MEGSANRRIVNTGASKVRVRTQFIGFIRVPQ